MISGLHIEPTNICTLKCSGCSRTQFINQWPQHWRNHNLNIDALIKFLDVDLTDSVIKLCGNYGDPIYYPELFELIKWFKTKKSKIVITTNGSYKKQQWWERLAELLDERDIVRFSVDGTPENFILYRENAEWESIKTGMEVMAKSRCHTIWKYIPFAFNQDDIERVENLSNQLGIKQFQVEFSDRFDQSTQHLIPDKTLIGDRYQSQIQWRKSTYTENEIDAKCKSGSEHFITAEGFYSPCCYLADHRFYYKTVFGKQKKQYSIADHTLSEILSLPITEDFYKNLDQQAGCQFNCPKTHG
jgi:wyosine [tRNA(Phe)-imidazoG37] synthetase (radical SAM superfamily)